MRLRDALIGAAGRGIDLGRAFHRERLVGALATKPFNEGVEFPLLPQNVGARRASGLLLPSQVHPFVTAVLLRMTGLNTLDRDAQP